MEPKVFSNITPIVSKVDMFMNICSIYENIGKVYVIIWS